MPWWKKVSAASFARLLLCKKARIINRHNHYMPLLPLPSPLMPCKVMYPVEEPGPEGYMRQNRRYAVAALGYHNVDPSNDVKYKLVEATNNKIIFTCRANYFHVNFA
ncbi:hypothetical protein E2562_022548 [Oryza meyeriana var. granulata]|uniref:Uncharacterized protein n=1 Tax=Oryza meyeriana var. granulata TaxID=110450 RepID=A0A6G1FAY2_9ORYZ|nr:hypothetical protein E2562_022548 [Oryza meyeriana var. granulata]